MNYLDKIMEAANPDLDIDAKNELLAEAQQDFHNSRKEIQDIDFREGIEL